ncbi:MAG: hypothetical protein WCH01_04090 [Methylococcaceae bacterium]
MERPCRERCPLRGVRDAAMCDAKFHHDDEKTKTNTVAIKLIKRKRYLAALS